MKQNEWKDNTKKKTTLEAEKKKLKQIITLEKNKKRQER